MLMSLFMVFVCFIGGMAAADADPPCPDSWSHNDAGQTCVKAFDGPKAGWVKAREFCQNQKGDLVKIKSEEKNTFVKGLLQRGTRNWIGAQYNHQTNELSFLGKNEKASYQPWAYQEPNNYGGNEGCVEIIGNDKGSWNDNNCRRESRFVCERPATIYCTFEPGQDKYCPYTINEYATVKKGLDHTTSTTEGHFVDLPHYANILFNNEENSDVCLSYWAMHRDDADQDPKAYVAVYLLSSDEDADAYPVHQSVTKVWTQYKATIASKYKKGGLEGFLGLHIDDIRISPGPCP